MSSLENLKVGDLIRVKLTYFAGEWKGRPAIISKALPHEYNVNYFNFPNRNNPTATEDCVIPSNDNFELLQKCCIHCKKVACPALVCTDAFQDEQYDFIRDLEKKGNLHEKR